MSVEAESGVNPTCVKPTSWGETEEVRSPERLPKIRLWMGPVVAGLLLARCALLMGLFGIEVESKDRRRLEAGTLLLLSPEGTRYLHLMLSGNLRNSGGTPLPNYTVSINPSSVVTSINYPIVALGNTTCPVAISSIAPSAICAKTDTAGFFAIDYSRPVAGLPSGGAFSVPVDVYDATNKKQATLSIPVSYAGGQCTAGTPSVLAAPGATVTLQTFSPGTACSLPGIRQIAVVVINANLQNMNKSVYAAAVELWAATTLYESPGFQGEKVKLTTTNGWLYSGVIPLADTGSRTVIVFDDVFTSPHPYGGTPVPGFAAGSQPVSVVGGSGGHSLIPTDDYFSPCGGRKINGTTFMASQVMLTAQAAGGGNTPFIPAPRLPVLGSQGSGFSSTTSLNDEVYTIMPGQSAGSLTIVDYLTFANSNNSFCECTTTVNVRGYSGSVAHDPLALSGFFTDTNFEGSGGACVSR